MTERKDALTASRVDLVVILLPIISNLEAAWTLGASGVPLEVAARVLATPSERRAMLQQQLVYSSVHDTNSLPVHHHRTRF
jgi:hypothetical protein